MPRRSTLPAIDTVNIDSGTVVLNGTNSATTVTEQQAARSPAPAASIRTMTIISGGTFAPGTPGSPAARSTITGSVTFEPAAIYQITINPTQNSLGVM